MSRFIAFGISFFIAGILYSQWADITVEADIRHAHRSGSMFGGGVAMVDLNNDGWLDIVVTGGVEDDVIYWNNRDKTFDRDVRSLTHNFSKTYTTSAISYLDFNHDGCIDLLFSTLSPTTPNILLQSDCQGAFIDVTNAAGLALRAQTMGAAIFDANLDGWDDIYFVNYIESYAFIRDSLSNVIGFDHNCLPNSLYINNRNGRFSLAPPGEGAEGCGCSLAAETALVDGQPVIYVANDFGQWLCPNEYFVYSDSGFIDLAGVFNLDVDLFGMGISSIDFNDDDQLDYYVSDIGSNPFLLSSDTTYMDQATVLGIDDKLSIDSFLNAAWGVSFLDADLDGDQDLMVANGYIPSAPFLDVSFDSPISFYENVDRQFYKAQKTFFDAYVQRHRGLAKGDIDNDGDEDVFIQTVIISTDESFDPANSSILLENQTTEHNWLSIQLVDEHDNSIVGSCVTIYYNGTSSFDCVKGGGSYASQHANRLHFGLGKSDSIDSIRVDWPNSSSTYYFNPPINQFIELSPQRNGLIEVLGCTDETSDHYNVMATKAIDCADRTTATADFNPLQQDILVYPTLSRGDIFLKAHLPIRVKLSIFDQLGRFHAVWSDVAIGVEPRNLGDKITQPGVYIVWVSSLNGDYRQAFKIIRI